MNALAHVIVTEGLLDDDFIGERCDIGSFREWLAFAARPEHSPEAVADETGVPAADIRGAARLYATGGNARHLLRPRRHRAQPGLDHGHGHRQPRHGHRQHRPRGRRRESAARPEQRAGLLRHGLVPARAAGLPARQRRRGARDVRRALGRDSCTTSRASASPTCSTPAVAGTFKGIYIQGEDIAQSDPNTQHVEAALAHMECVIVQDLFLNETAKFAHVFLPGTIVPGEGRHLHQRRAAHQPRAQGDASR